MNQYQVIYADPPWEYGAWSKRGNGTAEKHYKTMGAADIAALPVSSVAADNCALFLWATMPTLPQAISLMESWGFAYKTAAFTWIKTTKPKTAHPRGLPYIVNGYNDQGDTLKSRPAFGTGHYTRANAEICLLGIRGRMPVADRSVEQVIVSPRGEHSGKPPEARERIERLYPSVTRLEMFARAPADGWDVWGNEVDCDLDLVAT